jgi:2-polyprenyl-3-methyl-5-hydroxy-6-metoxy-1,4-benzoquinol methylase
MNQTTDQPLQHAVATCPLCTSETSEILAHQLRRGSGMVRFCPACDHGYLVQEQVVDAKEYYGELYRQEYSHNAEAAATHAREIYRVYKNYQQDRLHHISPHLTARTRLLEVGASAGQFLIHVKDKVNEVNAIELDTACCAFLSGELDIEADAEFLENSRFADQIYDVVCAFQVIEHVEQPVEFLKTLRQATKKGGTIFIEAPNLHDPLLSVWDVPTYRKFFYHSAHLHYFTDASLSKVARDAGFRPDQIEISFTQDYNLLNHLHWIMNNGPQADCHVGLSEINLRGSNQEIAAWLTEEVRSVNRKYMAKLIAAKCTSNMLMKLRHD